MTAREGAGDDPAVTLLLEDDFFVRFAKMLDFVLLPPSFPLTGDDSADFPLSDLISGPTEDAGLVVLLPV